MAKAECGNREDSAENVIYRRGRWVSVWLLRIQVERALLRRGLQSGFASEEAIA